MFLFYVIDVTIVALSAMPICDFGRYSLHGSPVGDVAVDHAAGHNGNVIAHRNAFAYNRACADVHVVAYINGSGLYTKAITWVNTVGRSGKHYVAAAIHVVTHFYDITI